jgi:hypothetical protein
MIEVIQHQNKLNTFEVLDKYKILPKNEAMMNILLCRLLTMLIVKLALKIDVLKLEKMFFTNYHEGEKAFYISSTN